MCFVNNQNTFSSFTAKHPLNINAKSKELDDLFHDVQATLEAKSIAVDHIVSYLISLFPNLENELECCKSLQEVFNGIRTYTSLDNVSHLETIISNYELPKYSNILRLYHKSVEELYEKTPINKLYEQTFMHHFTRHLLKEESMTLVIELKEDEKYTLLETLHLLDAIFSKMASYIKLMKVTSDSESVKMQYYAPSHLINVFVRAVKHSTDKVLQEGMLTVKRISIGGFNVFLRDLEIERKVSTTYINTICLFIYKIHNYFNSI